MANYIGKEPTPVPLSTADYQDGSITGVKLAPNAASTNLGFVPFNPTTGGTINGATNFANNVGVSGTTTVEALIVNDPADFNDTFNVDGAATFTSTVALGGDPTLPLQAATKQYVDNNFQLSSGLAGQTLTSAGLALTNASARLIEFTTVDEFATITLPNATTLTVSNGKFVFHNDGGNPIGVYDFTGRLIGAIGPSASATLYLYSIATTAGSWSIVGRDVRPFFINNTAYLPLTGTAAADTLAAADFSTIVKMDTNKYVVIHKDATATNNQVYAYAINTATKPATVGPRTTLVPLSVGTSLVTTTPSVAYPVDTNTLFVANGASTSSLVVLSVTPAGAGSPIFNITGGGASAYTFPANPLVSNAAASELQTIIPVYTTTTGGITYSDTFVAVSAPTAALCAYQVFKIDGGTFRISAVTNTTGSNGTGFAGLVDLRTITFDVGTGVGAVGCLRTLGTVAPFSLQLDKIVIQKGAPGITPTITSTTSLAITGSAVAATANFAWCPDYSSPNFGCVFYYANTTILPTYNGVTGLLPANTAASLGATTVPSAPAGVALGYQRQAVASASATGLIGNARGLLFDYWQNGSWRAYVMTAGSTAFVKIRSAGGAFPPAQIADFAIPDGANTVLSSMSFIGTPSTRDLYYTPDDADLTPPSLAILCSSTPTAAAGSVGGAKIYVCNETSGTNKIDLKDVFAPSTFVIRDTTPTLIGYQQLSTLNGFFMVPVGPSSGPVVTPAAAAALPTVQLSFNTWAAFKLNNDGSLAYYGNWNLPTKVVNELCFNSQYVRQKTEITYMSNSVAFSQAEVIPYREFVRIDTVFE